MPRFGSLNVSPSYITLAALALLLLLLLPYITSIYFMSPVVASSRLAQLQAQLRRLPSLLSHTAAPILAPPVHHHHPALSTHTRTNMSKQEPPSPTPPTPPTAFLDAIAHRRSVYALNATSPVPDSALAAMLARTMLHVPSAFNSQSARAVLLLGADHPRFWALVDAALTRTLAADAERLARAQKRLPGFRAAKGTVLFFESGAAVAKLREQAAAYAALVPGWSEHASGMHQFAVWTAFEAAGLGANLQHYNFVEGVDDAAKEAWGLPADWVLQAQLVFGGVEEGGWPKEGKERISTEETARVFGAAAE